MSFGRKLLTTGCALTRTTDLAARRMGAGYFLPALFVVRYANMGGLDRGAFARQLDAVRSFADERWCTGWDAIAQQHLRAGDGALRAIAGPDAPSLTALADGEQPGDVDRLSGLLQSGAAVLANHGPQPATADIDRLASDLDPDDPLAGQRARTLDEVVKAITYFQVSAFPGFSPARMRAYHRSRRLSDVLLRIVGPAVDLDVEPLRVAAGDETVEGYAVFPSGAERVATALVTNGLEGTVQELVLPLLRHRRSDLGLVVLEMPGTYAYRERMSPASEQLYHAVLEQLAEDPRVDADRIGMVGVSFGGYWAARMAAASSRLRCAVACGPPTHRTFGPAGSFGIPQVITDALAHVTGARHPLDLARRLRALSLRDRYATIPIPLLVINGDSDTLVSTQDSIDLAQGAPQGELVLYPDDDHCAMGHYDEWLGLTQQWLADNLVADRAPAGARDA